MWCFVRDVQLRLLRQKSSIKSTILFWLIDEWKCASLLTGISHDTVISILHEQLDMKKLSTRWVSRLLTVDHKRDRVMISKQYLEMFQHNPDEFLHRFTVDETWIYYFTPETKEQSKQWTSPGEPTPKKAKTVKSAGKVMATIFCTRYNSYRLSSIEVNDQWRLLHHLIGPFQ